MLLWLVVLIASMLMIVAFSLAGCKKAAPAEEEAVEEAALAEEEEAPAEEITEEAPEIGGTLEVWGYWDPGVGLDLYQEQICKDFEEETGVKVTFSVAGRDILNKLMPAINEGDPPDVFEAHGDEMYPMKETGMFLSLDDLLKEMDYGGDKTLGESLIPGSAELWSVDGTVYGIPNQIFTSMFFYDKDMFDNLGITDLPKTWDEMLEVADICKDNGIPPFSQDGGIDYYNAYWFTWFTYRIAGKGAFYEAAIDPTAEKWDNPDFLEAAKWVEKIAKGDYFIKDFDAFVFPGGQTAWEQGQGAMLLCGSWTIPYLGTIPDTFDVKTFPFPSIDGGKGAYEAIELATMEYAVPKDAKNPEAAKQYIRFAMQKKCQQMLLGDDLMFLPARNDMDPDKASSKLSAVVNMLNNATDVFTTYDGVMAEAEYWTKVFIPADQSLIFGEITAEEFISQIKEAQVEFYK